MAVYRKCWASGLPALAALLLSPLLCAADSGLVSIEVQANDRITNQPIEGISCADFDVWVESRPAQIVDCKQAEAPLRDVLVLLDFSGGHGDEAVLYSAPGLLGLLRPGDRSATMFFAGDDVQLASPLTSDRDLAGKRLRALIDLKPTNSKSIRRSGLYDAILTGAQFLSETSDVRRPLIVVVTHNREGKSDATEAEVVAALLKSSISLEAVTVPQQGSKRGLFNGDWKNLPWETPGVDMPSNLQPEPPRTFLDDLFSVEPILAKVGGTVVRLDYEHSRPIRDNKQQRYWSPNAVTLALERELVQRMRKSFVLTIRGAATDQPEFHPLEVRLTTEARRNHPAATVAAPSGFYARFGANNQR